MLFLADRTIALPKISSLRVQNMFCDSLKESEKDKKKMVPYSRHPVLYLTTSFEPAFLGDNLRARVQARQQSRYYEREPSDFFFLLNGDQSTVKTHLQKIIKNYLIHILQHGF